MTTAITTVEKLFLQIFEAKNRIKQQVKQQTDFYTQHLASKLLVDGITPPAWLWNDNQSSDVPKELSKEDLVSEILLPHPRPTIRFPSSCCSLYNKLDANGDYGEQVDGFSKETYSCNKRFDGGDKQTISVGCHEYNTECTAIVVPELDVSITSPQDETDVRISNIYSAPDQSVARIQRSKSRQKALELRNSSKALSRSRLNQENDIVSSPARNRLSIFSSEQDQVMDFQEFGQPCVVNIESCGGGESNVEGNNFCTGTRSRSSDRQPGSKIDFQIGDSFTDNTQEAGCSLAKDMHDFQQGPDLVNVSLEIINSDVAAECGGFIEASAEDCSEYREKCSDACVGRISRASISSQRPCFLNGAAELDVSVHSAMVDDGVVARSNDRSVQRFDDANDFLGVRKHSVELVNERTRSQTTLDNGGMPMLLDTANVGHHGETRSIYGSTENSQAVKYEVQNSSDAQIVLPFPDTHDVLNHLGNFENVIGDDLVRKLPANSRSTLNDAGLECLLTKSSSDYLMLMEPKQLFFDDREEYNLKDKSIHTDECRRLQKSPDEVFDTSLDPSLSLTDQLHSGDMISEKPLIVEREVSTKEKEIQSGLFRSNSDGNDDVQMKKKKSDTYDYSTLNTVVVDLEAVQHVPNLEFTCPANVIEPNVVESPDTESDMNLYCKEICEPKLLHKEGDYAYKGKEKSSASHSSESKNFRASDFSHLGKKAIGMVEDCLIKEVGTPCPTNIIVDATGQHCVNDSQDTSCLGSKPCFGSTSNMSGTQKTLESSALGGNDLFTCGSVGSPLGNHENLDVLRSGGFQIAEKSVVERNLRYVEGDSWPRCKRRKIQDQETDSFSASPSFRLKRQYASQRDFRNIKLKKVGDDVETVTAYASPMNESTEMEICQNMACQLTKESLPRLQTKEYTLNSEEPDEDGDTSFSYELGQLGGTNVSNLIMDPARISQGLSTEEMNLASTRNDNNEEDHKHLLHLEREDNLVNSGGLVKERSLLEGKSYLGVDGQLSCGLAWSSPKNDLDVSGGQEMMPELEGFIIDPQTENEEMNIPGHGINFDKFKFPGTSTERASVLEQICKSTITETPLPQLSAFKLLGSQKFCHSVPNGLLECIDLRSISALNEDADDRLRASYGHNGNDHLKKMSYSDFLPSSGAQFGWDSRITCKSPIGKLWERMSLHTGSSEKRLNSNPELTCFTIEEDPSVSEENEKASEVTEKIQEEIGSLIYTCAKREPLADITEANTAASTCAGDKFLNRASVEYVNTEASLKGPLKKVKHKLQNSSRNMSEEKENNMLPVVANGIKKTKESTSSRSSRANTSCKTSLKIERQKVSEKKPKRNNIVSNVTSFIPLVQQKQAAAVCKGKRDVKVKALEAAEAAKRLEEKRQNERQMRKEALKLERARIEQEKLREMELNKKKKGEERKKRDADIVAKKRLREEEERKEERKRKRIEEARRLQREEGTLCSQKLEKKLFLNIDKEDYKTKESDNSRQNMVIESHNDVSFKKPETKQRPDEFTVHLQQAGISVEACGTAGDSCEHEKARPALCKSGKMDNLNVQKSPEKSYDISPYRSSDDEEEDEEENIPKKFIPSWASKNCVALVLPLQQGIEPEVIFPPESFCRVDKLVFQRKQKESSK